jgi:hypothetical protein
MSISQRLNVYLVNMPAWSLVEKGAQAMVRIAVLVVAILVGYDHFMYNGVFRSAALQATNQILHHFGVI